MPSEFSELASQVLSQDEIESLLEQFSNDDDDDGKLVPPTKSSSASHFEQDYLVQSLAGDSAVRKNLNLPRINFRIPSYLKSRQVRFLEVRHDQFARRLTDRLSLYLRKEVKIELIGFEVKKYDDIKTLIEGVNYLAEIHIDKFPVNGFVQIPVEMSLLIIDRMLGGNGEKYSGKGGLTEIEIVLLDQLVGHVMDQWALIWEDLTTCRHKIIGHESEMRHLHITGGQNPVTEASFLLRIAQYEGTFRMVFPGIFWEPILSRVSEVLLSRTTKDTTNKTMNPEAMAKLRLTIRALWEGREMTARELASIKPGDLIYFNKAQANKTTIMVADLAKFVGQIGESDGKRAVMIEQVIEAKTKK